MTKTKTYSGLQVQQYLLAGKTPEDLKEDLGIKFYRHPDLPLVGFKYCQIDSPRSHPIVRECRGLVLEEGSWRIVAKGFNRFFNVGELQDEFKRFNWSDFHTHSKEDGSLILVYYYEGAWHVNTSGSFGLGELDTYGATWRQLFWDTAPFDPETLSYGPYALQPSEKESKLVSEHYTYVFELCTPYNKVVRTYQPTVYLLSVFDHFWQDEGPPSLELEQGLVDRIANRLGCKRPERFDFGSQDEIRDFLLKQEEDDSTFEGVILHDSHGMRYKWKTQTYLSLHRMKDNGNVLHPKNLVPIVLANEQHEVIAVMPECTSALNEVAEILEATFNSLLEKWEGASGAQTQKDFALSVKDHPLCSLLFKLRKTNPTASQKDLEKLWRESGDQILKTLFRTKRFKFDVIALDDDA